MTAWASKLRERGREIADSIRDGNRRRVARGVKALKKYFGAMGSLNDLVISEMNRNLHPGLSETAANERLDRLLDELFMWCLFWDLEREAALKAYRQLLQKHPHNLPPRIRHAFGHRWF
jgi:hypothetical protein